MRAAIGCTLLFLLSTACGRHGASGEATQLPLADPSLGRSVAGSPVDDGGVDPGTPIVNASDGAVVDVPIIPSGTDGGTAIDASPVPTATIEQMHSRADRAVGALMINYWSQLRTNTTAIDWMFAQYWQAVLDASQRRGPAAFTGTIRMFYDLQAQRGWLDDSYNDENWLTLALLQAYNVTRDTTYLDQAKTIFADVMLAWDETCCGDKKGGLWLGKLRDQKSAVINGGAAIAGAQLYDYTQDQRYLDFAKKTYAFWATSMTDPVSGHVFASVTNTGTIDAISSSTYNEGLMIGAATNLARLTKDPSYLAQAHKIAKYVLTKESAPTAFGAILSDGKCSGDAQMYKAPAARYIGELFAADPAHGEYRDLLVHSATAAWNLARDRNSNNISCDWAGPFDQTTALVGSLGSAAIGLSAAAKALGAGQQRTPLVYEAEEGNVRGAILEANFRGYSGWGYVAGWGSDGQGVDILVDVPTAGTYAVRMRYGTPDQATRQVAVNGQVVSNVLFFQSTGAFGNYRDTQINLQLVQGRNKITFTLNRGVGNSGFLNLDQLSLMKR